MKDILSATSEDTFLQDEVFPAAVLHHLTVIGEAINRSSVELRALHPEVRGVKSLRCGTGIVHAHFDLDCQILWDAATGDVPQLHRQVLDILTTEFPDSLVD